MSSRFCIQMCEPCTYDTDRKVPPSRCATTLWIVSIYDRCLTPCLAIGSITTVHALQVAYGPRTGYAQPKGLWECAHSGIILIPGMKILKTKNKSATDSSASHCRLLYASVGTSKAKTRPHHKSRYALCCTTSQGSARPVMLGHTACAMSQAASTLSLGQERPGLMDRRGTPAWSRPLLKISDRSCPSGSQLRRFTPWSLRFFSPLRW